MSFQVGIVPTGIANTASIKCAFERLGASVEFISEADEILTLPFVVLPGVGAFASGMEALAERGFAEALRSRVSGGLPLLSVCLGMQLLCAESEESPGVPGLNVVDARVERFNSMEPVPQLGWNEVVPERGSTLMKPGYAYFANSFCIKQRVAGWECAMAVYGEEFVACMRKGKTLACQFHPELSGAWGAMLLKGWVTEG